MKPFDRMIMKDRSDVTDQIRVDLGFEPATAEEITAIAKARGLEGVPDGYIAGWASTSDGDAHGHMVKPNAFKDAIATRGLTGPKGIKFLIGHDWGKPAGLITVLEYRGKGRLWIEVQLNLAISYAKDFYEAVKSVGGMSFSVGFFLQDYEFQEDDAGKEWLIIKRADLFEVSGVPFPANEECGMQFVKTAPEAGGPLRAGPADSMADFERSLVQRGLAKSRSEAHRIVEAFKESAHLFKWGAPEKQPNTDQPKPAATIDLNRLDQLSKQIDALRQALAN